MNELDPSQTGASDTPEDKGQPRRVIRLSGFFADSEGGLHRGAPTWVYDEEGNEIPVLREHNSGEIFPREVAPPETGSTPTEG
ncbi:hypothetical protein A2686_00895 [Candidatus Woesebacteria bacterium RIFCSPHIGHO2_01_FULL_38_10]|uniref:Uncharacterized protein n=1 Tax=Candidatus Woesebacteria bacterium RIFCSPLOWO2_01_FULL_39_10b TaxID=1802517 RepID=A0A1F8B9D5_9BACT|nr:MAG: hypothetical protein A2686_00895 [Candidatus Woesebacteria bacterium RIFCSPHIGHO2_01_FULL_38_10]OGM60664.1 MAG: hypothetical protein A2892_01290 [Candidatus Woesebacteria bacterium RIFCSPLOWO2_01_FULL_39_10b]